MGNARTCLRVGVLAEHAPIIATLREINLKLVEVAGQQTAALLARHTHCVILTPIRDRIFDRDVLAKEFLDNLLGFHLWVS